MLRFKVFLNLIRAIFPNWNFFDKVAYNFEVEFKVKDAKVWEKISFDQTRQSLGLFVNPDCTVALAQVNIIEHFAKDIQDLQDEDSFVDSKDVQNLTTFKMLRSLISAKLQEYDFQESALQFKIVACSPNEKIDVYISDWIIVGRA